MRQTFRKRRMMKALLGCLVLPLASAGCQHSHVATTQVVLSQDASTQPAASQAIVPENTTENTMAAPTTQESAGASGSSGIRALPAKVGHGVARASRVAGHDVAQASRVTGHAVAQASRNAYYSSAAAVGQVPSSTVDIAKHGAVGIRNTPPESLTAPVIDVDEAMQVRDWDQVTATYSSGATVAGPIGFLYAPRPGQNAWRYQVIDLPLFLGNTALLPFAFAQTPPWKPVEWKAATVEPTYTGVPPLPAD